VSEASVLFGTDLAVYMRSAERLAELEAEAAKMRRFLATMMEFARTVEAPRAKYRGPVAAAVRCFQRERPSP
jgi:hypothetical protein